MAQPGGRTIDGAHSMIEAAGGIVIGEEALAGELVLVHRRLQQDWTFPKGKVRPNERPEAAALREVCEETGLVCTLGPALGSILYKDRRGRSKRSSYWLMTVMERAAAPGDEVDHVEWFPFNRAVTVLSYKHDRQFLHGLMEAWAGTGP